jgi:hypothetical protein
LNKRVNEVTQENEKITQRLHEEYERIASERNNINLELNELFTEKSEKDIVIKNLTNENLELNSRMNALEQLLCAKEDQDSRFDSLQESYNRLNMNKDKYK